MDRKEIEEMVKNLNKFFLDVGLSCKVETKKEAESYFKSIGKVVGSGEEKEPIIFFFLSEKEILLDSSGKKIFSANIIPFGSRYKDKKDGRIGRDDGTFQETKDGISMGINWEDGTKGNPLASELERIRETEIDNYNNFGMNENTEELKNFVSNQREQKKINKEVEKND